MFHFIDWQCAGFRKFQIVAGSFRMVIPEASNEGG
jgi:hypothetical protein